MRQTPHAHDPADGFPFDYGLYNGRFQIVTEAHLHTARQMTARARRGIINIGSINRSRDTRNPFTFDERREMWEAALGPDHDIVIIGQEDRGNGPKWASEVQAKVEAIIAADGATDPEVMIIGHRKDTTSDYLYDFPLYQLEEVRNVGDNLSASTIRAEMFRVGRTAHADGWFATLRGRVPDPVVAILRRFMDTDVYADLVVEFERNEALAAQWKVRDTPDGPGVPYPVLFNTSDAFITQGNSMLLVKRRGYPGRGLWALPGGFVNERERVLDAAIRETFEETKLNVSDLDLRKSLVDDFYEDEPWRSTRGRTITFVHMFQLKPTPTGRTSAERRASVGLPRVRGTDDAEIARWFTFDQVADMREQLFEDHAILIEKALARMGRIKRSR